MRIPSADAPELEWLRFEQSDVLTTAQAVAGLGRGPVRGRLTAGTWRRLCRGILVAHNGPLTPRQMLWAAVLAAGPGALLGGATAAREGGLRLADRGPIHVLVPAGRERSRRPSRMPLDMRPVIVHRAGSSVRRHRQVGLPPRTTMARSVVDAGQWARSDDEGRTILAAACQQRLVTAAEVLDVLAELPRARRRALLTATAHDIAGGAEALAEIDFLRLCRRHALPLPDRQHRRTDGRGRTRYLDAYWERFGLQVEVDGAHHMNAEQWAADMRRQNALWIAGDRVLRFPAFVVRRRRATAPTSRSLSPASSRTP